MVPGSSISVIVPSRNEGARLLRCIGSLSRLGLAGEIVVAACDERAAVRERATRCPRLHWVNCETASRGSQLNRGAAAARGDILLFLHADTQLPPSAADRIQAALRDPGVAGGAFRLAFDVDHAVLGLLSRLSRLSITPAFLGDQGMFCRRNTFEAIGGFNEAPLFEDVEFAGRLARTGRLVRMRSSVTTSARRFVDHGPWQQLALNVTLLALYHAGVSTRRLADVYSP